jgi:hypothetical protein
MNTRIVMILLCTCFLSSAAVQQMHAQDGGRFGLGFVFGEPTGFTWRYRINYVNSVDGSIGFIPEDRARINVDYQWHHHTDPVFAFHYGIGAAFGLGGSDYVVFHDRGGYFVAHRELGFGVRVPLGFTIFPSGTPLDIFLEVAPVLVLTPETGVGVDAGIGVRIYP